MTRNLVQFTLVKLNGFDSRGTSWMRCIEHRLPMLNMHTAWMGSRSRVAGRDTVRFAVSSYGGRGHHA